MQAQINSAQLAPPSAEGRYIRLIHALDHAAHLLPTQGPIGVFIHHNTLHAFQHLPFDEALSEASSIFGTESYMAEDAYRQCLARGRILEADIWDVVNREANEVILPGRLDRRLLRGTLLLAGQASFDPATVDWILKETGILEPGGHALYAACLELAGQDRSVAPSRAGHPMGLQRMGEVDLDEVIHPLLIRLCSAFLDQGVAYWPMPNRHNGFLGAVRDVMAQRCVFFAEYLERLDQAFREQLEHGSSAEEVVIDALERFGVPEEQWESVLTGELQALPGWAGTFRQLEINPGLAPYIHLPCSLMEFVAVRLTLKSAAALGVARRRGMPSDAIREIRTVHDVAARHTAQHTAQHRAQYTAQHRADALVLWDAIKRLGLGDIVNWNPTLQRRLVSEIRAFHQMERRRLLHLAYERRHEEDVLQAVAWHRREHPPVSHSTRPFADVFFCIDEREESIRRHLEEVAPEVRTHGTAGFFGVAMHYTGIDDAHGAALCPVVVKPQHSVHERPLRNQWQIHDVRVRRRRMLARMVRHTYLFSRALVRGWVSAAALWPLSLIPLVARVLAPRRYGLWKEGLHRKWIPEPSTELAFERPDAEAQITSKGLFQGFTLAEATDRVAGTLGNAGLREGFARLVAVLGHGSTSLNNPHESAHDCGACGGGRGGPNGRVFAAMANSPEVRGQLLTRGITIPSDTWFVGGYHDTSNADITLFDLDRVPLSHVQDLAKLREFFDAARAFDAEERVRRFEAASPYGGPRKALLHVQDRAERLSEPRPEYGHCTNAVCIVGRRELTRGLFLDRRAFLVSYDAASDPEDHALARLLGAVVPVCGGISLEYYFSFVDNERYGCGTKLPHNVTGLIGVMNGPASDLRTGLPWQMVEVHEPMRILFVVETTPQRVMKVMSGNPELTEFLENRWIRLATVDPDSGQVQIRRGDGWEMLSPALDALPSVQISADWFRGKIDHLPIAHVTGSFIRRGT